MKKMLLLLVTIGLLVIVESLVLAKEKTPLIILDPGHGGIDYGPYDRLLCMGG